MQRKHILFIGDARAARLEPESVHLVITSPPYWHIKDYGIQEQIGYGQSYQDYVNDLNLVWKKCVHALVPGCKIAINIGDQFLRAKEYGSYSVLPIRTEIIRFMLSMGLDYMGAIIWQKKTSIRTSGGASIMGSFPYPRNGVVEIDYEFILLFKKPGKGPVVPGEIKQSAKIDKDQWKQLFSGHWKLAGQRKKTHEAPFPLEIPHRLIRMFSFPGETVFDPFVGSGTTILAAAMLDRNSVSYEINPDLVPIIERRVSPVARLEVIRDQNPGFDRREALSELPYIFHDPKALRRIRQEPPEEQEYLRVRQVIGPTEILLSDGRRVFLAGIKERPGYQAQAVEFLRRKTRGQLVFVKADPKLPESQVYLFLKNKTHLNAHLIKKGLALVDVNKEFKHKKRFLRWQEAWQRP